MNVLMTADAVGGVWNYALELVRALAPLGVHVDLAVMGPAPDPAQCARARTCDNLTLHTGDYRLEWMDDCWSDVHAAGEWLLELERMTAPDVVHLNGYVHAALPWHAPALVVAHSCVLSWWRATLRAEAPARYDTYRAQVTAGLTAAHTVVAPTAAMLRMLEDSYGPLRRVRVIPNGRSPHPCYELPKEDFVLSVGRLWDEAKNLHALERAAARLDVPVRVAGPDTDPQGRRIRLQHMQLLGTLGADELADQYARAAVFALPARYEPFGLAALEAGLAGCALVLGDTLTLREVWGDAALFVGPDDDETLAATIERLIAEPGIRADFAQRARRRGRQYTAARMAAAYHGLYWQLPAVQSTTSMVAQ